MEQLQDVNSEISTAELINKTATIMGGKQDRVVGKSNTYLKFCADIPTPYVTARIPIATTVVLVAQLDGRTHQPPRAKWSSRGTTTGRRERRTGRGPDVIGVGITLSSALKVDESLAKAPSDHRHSGWKKLNSKRF